MMLSFDSILTKTPHAICAVFASDLHLSAHTPALNTGFCQFINQLHTLHSLKDVYILGDFLDAWAGDDEYLIAPNTHWLQPVVITLKTLSANTNLYLMHGNRDFMIGQKLCRTLGAKLIDAPYYLDAPLPTDWDTPLFDDFPLNKQSHRTIRLEHGDALCTDDVSYQRYRAIIQHPITKICLSALPLSVRQRLAGTLKNTSTTQKTQKKLSLMDVNNHATAVALTTCDTLIHGHTHRPFVHSYKNKQRLVLGDWRLVDGCVCAEVAVLLTDGQLLLCRYHTKA